MAYYDIYDANDNRIASNVFLDETERADETGGGGSGFAPLVLWIASLFTPFVLGFFCVKTYFDGTDQLFYRICSALPMLLTMALTGILVYLQGELVVLKLWTLRRYSVRKRTAPSEARVDAEADDLVAKVWERRLSKLGGFAARFWRLQRYVRYVLLFLLSGCVFVGLLGLPFRPDETMMLPLLGPLFAYAYVLGIVECVLLPSGSAWVFGISLVGGSAIGYLLYSTLHALEPYLCVQGLEVFIVLACILGGLELGMRLFRDPRVN